MWTPVYYAHYVDLPMSVEGVTIPNNDGSFDVFINKKLPSARQKHALRHELEHIMRDHMYDARPVRQLEDEADWLADYDSDLPVSNITARCISA